MDEQNRVEESNVVEEQSVVEQPVVEQPVVEEPPVVEQPVIKEPKEEVKKKSSPIKPIIIILVIALLGVGAYLAYDKLFADKDNKEKEEPKEEVVKEEISIDNPAMLKLYYNFRGDQHQYIDKVKSSNVAKIRIAYENIAVASFSSISCSQLDGSLEMDAKCGDGTEESFNSTKTITSKLMKEKLVELFGSYYTYKAEDFGIGDSLEPKCKLMHYDENNDLYAYFMQECEKVTSNTYKEQITSAYKEGNKLFIEAKTVKGTSENDKEVGKIATYEFKKDPVNGNYVFANYTRK